MPILIIENKTRTAGLNFVLTSRQHKLFLSLTREMKLRQLKPKPSMVFVDQKPDSESTKKFIIGSIKKYWKIDERPKDSSMP